MLRQLISIAGFVTTEIPSFATGTSEYSTLPFSQASTSSGSIGREASEIAEAPPPSDLTHAVAAVGEQVRPQAAQEPARGCEVRLFRAEPVGDGADLLDDR